jgi:hypothetical protein
MYTEIIESDEITITKNCENCGRIFTIPKTKRRGRTQKYCCHRCGVLFHCRHVRDKKTHKTRIAKYFADNPERRFLASTKISAKKRGLAFDLSIDWFKERLDRGVCEVTGLPIKIKQYKEGDTGQRGFYSPSIDRIDNNVGYLASNCRMVCWGYNLGKHQFTDRDLNALSISLLIQSLPPSMKNDFLKLMPPVLLASLPSGHQLF